MAICFGYDRVIIPYAKPHSSPDEATPSHIFVRANQARSLYVAERDKSPLPADQEFDYLTALLHETDRRAVIDNLLKQAKAQLDKKAGTERLLGILNSGGSLVLENMFRRSDELLEELSDAIKLHGAEAKTLEQTAEYLMKF